MAITTLIQPSELLFAGNPILFEATTDHSLGTEESFLRVVCTATFTLNGTPPYHSGATTFTAELSQPVADGGTAVFNLSDAAQTLVRSVQAQMDMNDGDVLTPYSVYADVSFKDVWIYENQEITGSSETANRFYIVPGALTDFEMLTMSSIYLPTLAASGKTMTRKPDGGILYRGETLLVPTLLYGNDSSQTTEATLAVGGKPIASSPQWIEGNKLEYVVMDTSDGTADGVFEFTSGLAGSRSGYYRTNTQGVHFLRFINGFGAVENISVRAKDKLTYEVSGETHSLVQEATTRPTDRRYATKSQPVGVYELSSGYVPQQWAEWYVQELLTSPRVWIQLGGKWIPALIEAEDDCVIYDRTKPEMPHVDFTLRLAIDGVTGVTW